MTHFYLTLPSNSSENFFPDNTLTDFTTKLSSTIDLTNEWEVGLAEMMFPRSWCTIPKEGLTIVVDYWQCYLKPPNYDPKKFPRCDYVELNIRGGFYHSMEELVLELNNSSRGWFTPKQFPEGPFSPPVFLYQPISKRVHITLPSGMTVTLPRVLETILGLAPWQNPVQNQIEKDETIRGELPCDLQAGIHALYVYCDLLQFTHVGDIKAPLLRVVNSGVKVGDVVTRYYERPRYIPLQKKNFDSIQIIIRDDLGEKIQFESGKVLLTLHFRRTHNQYLL